MAFVAISCSKEVEVKGKVNGGSPLNRLEIIEASSINTLPLVNLGVDKDGFFTGKFTAPKNGMYVISYGGSSGTVYLKAGDKFDFTGNAMTFPHDLVITGDAKANNDFLKDAQTGFEAYAMKINMEELLKKDEAAFLKEFQKINDDVNKIFEDGAKKYKADGEVLTYKKNETKARLIGVIDAYEQMHGQIVQNPKFTVSEEFNKVRDSYLKDSDNLLKNYPIFREYQLNKLQGDFQKYSQGLKMSENPSEQPLFSKIFSDYLKTRKDLSTVAKDYFFSFILTQSDLNFLNYDKYDQITKLIDESVSDSKIKSDLKQLQKVLMGHEKGYVSTLKIEDKDGKSVELSSLKGKPTFVLFYTSWTPNIPITVVPELKKLNQHYKSNMNFAFVNLDDTKDQFIKTSGSLFPGIAAQHYWVNGGIDSKSVKDYGIYGFRLPTMILLDKDGKVIERPFFNIQDPSLVEAMSVVSSIKAPVVAPAAELPPSVEVVPSDSVK